MALDEGVTSTARALAQEAEQDFKVGRYADASDKFLKAYYAVKVPTLARSAARSLIQQKKLVRASELYRQALLLEPNELWIGAVQEDAQAKAKDELAALMPRLGRLKLQIRGAQADEVEISIDDVRIPNSLLGANQYVDPGEHHIVVKLGVTVVHHSVSISEGGKEEATLDLSAANESPAGHSSGAQPQLTEHESSGDTQRLLGWVGLGLGAVGVVVGTTAGIWVATKYSNLQPSCTNNVCTRDTGSYNSLRTVSAIGFISGTVGAAVGLTLLLTAPAADKPSVGVWLGPESGGIRGSF